MQSVVFDLVRNLRSLSEKLDRVNSASDAKGLHGCKELLEMRMILEVPQVPPIQRMTSWIARDCYLTKKDDPLREKVIRDLEKYVTDELAPKDEILIPEDQLLVDILTACKTYLEKK